MRYCSGSDKTKCSGSGSTTLPRKATITLKNIKDKEKQKFKDVEG
jgi:hypothetical protein